jgi:hypothetical protein
MLVALKWLEDYTPEGTQNTQAYAQAYFPKEDPHWDPNNGRDYQQLERYQEALLGGMKKGEKIAINVNKTSEVLQGPDEHPSQFYKHLYEAFHLYSPFDLEAMENQWMINASFVGQAWGA